MFKAYIFESTVLMFPSISDSFVEAIFVHRLVVMTASSPANQIKRSANGNLFLS